MSEVEKMYENAGVKKLLYCDICNAQEHALGLCAETKCEPFYPPFTAEKQIELIKLIACNKINKPYRYISLDKDEIDSRWYISLTKETIDDATSYSGKNINFANALAGLINSLWQDLTEQERTEIAEILRG